MRTSRLYSLPGCSPQGSGSPSHEFLGMPKTSPHPTPPTGLAALPDSLFLSQSGQAELSSLHIHLSCTCSAQHPVQAGASPGGCLLKALSPLDLTACSLSWRLSGAWGKPRPQTLGCGAATGKSSPRAEQPSCNGKRWRPDAPSWLEHLEIWAEVHGLWFCCLPVE